MPEEPRDRSQVLGELRRFLAEELGLARAGVLDETPLFESGLMDSMGLVSLVAFCEEAFDCSIPGEEITEEAFRSLATIADRVVSHWRRG